MWGAAGPLTWSLAAEQRGVPATLFIYLFLQQECNSQ